MDFLNTRQVAKLLGVKTSCLTKALWDGRVESPAKSPSGNFLWTKRDVEQASWIIRRRDASDILPSKEATFSQAE